MARTESPSVSVSRRGSHTGDADHAVVWVRGEHDVTTAVSLADALALAALEPETVLVVDLSGVTFMAASTIGAIVDSANRLRLSSRSLAVRAPSACAVRLLDLCGMTGLADPVPATVGHPSGPAAALGTWVEVDPVTPSEHRNGSDPNQVHGGVGEPVRPEFAAIEAEADRGDP